ncbi:hypothetical protein PTKIN_Ptkin03bG0123300 [Pterospermum kingtungense]
MRSGACTVQQTLTAEAASVLKHSLSLARRRGHAQVTPLHVAATLLSSRASLLRRTCLKSQPHQTSHPLQCRALELCFNVALNRLPTTPGPLLHGQPSLSNALIAALKRAQAHQRRGCIEQQQQQPLLTIKVELEQLIISILDDPSVSRVMREAGFSSTAVKNHIEDSSASSVFQCYSTLGGVFSSPCSPSPTDNPSSFWPTAFLFSPQKKLPAASTYITDSGSLKEDIKLVIEVFLRKRRKNTVIVGDCVSTTEGLVSEVMGRIERGDVPEEMKHVHFVKFYFAPVSLRFMKKEDVEKHLTELKRRVDFIACGREGAIIYTGDLRWTVEENLNGGYSAVDHLVTEIGRLLSDYNNLSNTKVWLMATANYQTYLRCQMRQPPLEAQWQLQAVSVPTGGLGLCLHASSVHDSRMTLGLEMKPFAKKEEHEKLTCCKECSSNYEKDVESFKTGHQKRLPPWLLHSHGSNNDSQKDEMRKRQCHSLHHNSCTIEFNFGINGSHKHQSGEANLMDSLKEEKITLGLGNSVFSDSGKPRKETSELCKLLQANVPWQSEIIPSIAEALTLRDSKKETWLLIEGNDVIGKRRLARAVAESVLGSADMLLEMDMNEVNAREFSLIRRNERVVVLVENVDVAADTRLLKLLADRFETEGGCSQAIFILSNSVCWGKKNEDSVIQMKLSVISNSDNYKRKVEYWEWDVSNNMTKMPRTNNINGNVKKDLSSFNTSLDLNMKADEEDDDSPISSDLTNNRYIFNQNSSQMKQFFMSKMKGLVEQTFGTDKEIRFSVEERVLEASTYFLNSLFDQWLKDIFQTGLETLKIRGEGIHEIRLSYGGILENALQNGYKGTCLPNKIHVSFMV